MDLTFMGEDYTDFIKNKEDYEAFERLKWLWENELHKHSSECLSAVIECIRIMDKLKGFPERKIIIQNAAMN